MKLKRASAWYYNKGTTHVVINELGITLHKGQVVDLFKLNPSLSWAQYMDSATKGVLFQKKHALIPLPGPPKKSVPPLPSKPLPSGPMRSRSKSALIIGKDSEDYLATIESEFPPDSQSLGQQEMWNTERDKYIQSLDNTEQGENGEVFSDGLFEDEYLNGLEE